MLGLQLKLHFAIAAKRLHDRVQVNNRDGAGADGRAATCHVRHHLLEPRHLGLLLLQLGAKLRDGIVLCCRG